MSKYKYFLVDADETILDFNKAEKNAIKQLFIEQKIVFDEKIYYRYHEINDRLWKEFERGIIPKKEIFARRFQELFSASGKKVDSQILNDKYFSFLKEGGFYLDGAGKFLNELKTMGKVYIITNGRSEIQRRRAEITGLNNLTDGIFISDEIGANKPDKEFFEIVEKSTGLVKSETVVIGDSVTSDIAGGVNYGIDTIWYNVKRVVSSIKPVFEARTYDEIIAFVR